MNNENILEERFELVKGRIRELKKEEYCRKEFAGFFREMTGFLNDVLDFHEKMKKGWLTEASLEELKENNHKMYGGILGETYETSYVNPAYAVKMLSKDMGRELSFLAAELRGIIIFAYEDRIFDMTVLMELYVLIYNMLEDPEETAEGIKDSLYWYVSDYSDEMISRRIREAVDPSLDFAADIICNSDLSDVRYLYRFGEYITEDELKMAEFLAGFPEEEIQAMARTYTEGYRIGFVNGRKDLSKKETVNIRYQLGFERMVKAAIEQFAQMGLKPVIYRSAVHVVNKRQHHRIGYYGAIPNKQMEYDHKDDAALFTDQEFVQRKLRVMQVAYEEVKDLAALHAGPAVIETFGEEPFSPVSKPEAYSLNAHQQKLQVNCNNEGSQIVNRYIKGEERSFTIIAYPVCQIGAQFEEIFKETVKINNLDYKMYQEIHQKLIDALDQGFEVKIHGCGINETDMTVRLHELKHPEKETNFENCVADVNIPVGEVFTSPVLEGTNGILHVSGVYLDGLYYKNLKITFKDGKIAAYSCENFESEKENKEYISDNILYHHDTLALGEFAIGTNTAAYVMAGKYHIENMLPILIAEKMGPHFAVGDTCYSWSEDVAVYNPDGKEIIARDNEVSLLRKKDVSKAYFGCHTDITIPYEELGDITVYKKDGTGTVLIKNGRFVLPGTEELNRVLDENQEKRA